MPETGDVIVVGLGGMGSAIGRALAQAGLCVTGFDQFEIGHDRGSSHGRTRVIRKAYFEDPWYVPMARRAYDLWAELEVECGQTLMRKTGCLNLGPPGHAGIQGVRRSVAEHRLPHEILDSEEVRKRWPVFRCGDHDVGIYEEDGGLLLPERCVAAQVEGARRAGAELHINQRVVSWRADRSRVVVLTNQGRYEANHLVIAAGAWLPIVAAELRLKLVIERQVQTWFAPRAPQRFQVGALPVFIHFTDDRAYYGIPIHEGGAFKAARHHGGKATTADTVDRAVSQEDEEDVRWYLRRHLPDADGPMVDAKVCLYSNTPDGHFIIDRHPDHANVVIAGGFSGHGFKFAPVVGEIVRNLIVGTAPRFGTALFSIARLRS